MPWGYRFRGDYDDDADFIALVDTYAPYLEYSYESVSIVQWGEDDDPELPSWANERRSDDGE